MPHTICWIDIPVLDLKRAVGFYGQVLSTELDCFDPPEAAIQMAVFKHGPNDVAGCLFQAEGAKPSPEGPLIYLNVEGRLDAAIGMVEQSGGKILEPKHPIGPHGFRAIVLDSEGNRVALHSM